jgi:DNA-binding IclR family transcriptional regulator
VSFSLASLVPLVLSGTAVLALLTALALAWQAQRRQRQLASRLGGATVVAPKRWEPARLRTWRDALLARVAAARATDASLQERLIRAGFSSPAAPVAAASGAAPGLAGRRDRRRQRRAAARTSGGNTNNPTSDTMTSNNPLTTSR